MVDTVVARWEEGRMDRLPPARPPASRLPWASLCALLCALPALADPAPAYLVKDIDTTPVGHFTLSAPIRGAGGAAYFTAQLPEFGNELWKSDGTASGTFMVADLLSAGSANPSLYGSVGGALLFAADSFGLGRELWKTDGTAAGTSLVKDIRPGATGSFPTESFAVVNGVLYFVANDGVHGFELWKSDGTNEGTLFVADIAPGAANGSPQQLRSVNGTLYFVANDGTHGDELWKSDGTQPGTVPVYVLPGSLDVAELVDVNGTLFFTAVVSELAAQLWKSDGTSAGTAVVRVFGGHVSMLVNANGTLFFRASDVVNYDELWKSDGTAAGTVRVYEVLPGAQTDFGIWELTTAGDRAFFTTASLNWPDFDPVLWASDGTPAGTLPVLSLGISPDAEVPDIHTFGSVGSTLYFAGSEAPGYDVELWKSDGTVAGTVPVADILPGPEGSIPDDFANVNGELWFEATGPHGTQLWKSDGTTAGTLPITSFDGTASTSLANVAELDGLLLFTLGYVDREPWTSDGTAAGTTVLKDIRVGPDGSFPGPFTNSSGALFFGADDGVSGRELWKTDGTSAGTVLVKDMWPGGSGSPMNLVDVDGTLFFAAKEPATGNELWKSDGSSAGTSRVRDLVPGPIDSNPGGTNGRVVNVNGTLFFATTNPAPGGLWKSDGTEAGTVQLGAFAVSSLTSVNGTLFFTRTTVATGAELWKSDGTTAGTVLVADIWPGSNGSSPAQLTNLNGTLFFAANDGTHGTELWKSDGTAAGTVLVKDLIVGPGSQPSAWGNLVVAGDTLFFVATEGVSGLELWKSDGTEAGTLMVKDVFPGPDDGASRSTPPVAVGSIVVFSGVDPVWGREVWASDGTAENTHLVADISPGAGGSTPLNFFAAGSRVFFEAFTNATGRELFAVPVAALMDSDLDGLDYAAETTAGTDPFDADSDGDGLTDGAEVNTYGTSPIGFDTDGDGFGDGVEVAAGTDPLDPQSFPPPVPLAGPLGFGALAALLLASGAVAHKRGRRCA
jgi:ELWxxDGT repeat protein